MLMNERVLKNIIKQDEDFQKFAMGRDIGDTEGEARGLKKGKTLGLQEGKVLGIEEGKTLGIEEAKHNMILEMYKKGIKLDIIADVSNLSEEKVNEIINEASSKIKK